MKVPAVFGDQMKKQVVNDWKKFMNDVLANRGDECHAEIKTNSGRGHYRTLTKKLRAQEYLRQIASLL